ncbi:hypothetical protein M9H77_29190 [Catharanthus roseus]|uniref:Uncharacterized protein n=1 Tax=Catharanthus roseus TaxID=4058 RepID=A0ACC0AIW5_CATRO|nr:hypothetical protein M9H77_29190 [Catharanthus roseus]
MPSRQPFSSNPKPRTSLIFLIITSSASAIILFAIFYFLYYFWYSLVHRSRTSPFDSTTPLVKLQKFPYKELKSATNSFSDSNSIGKGGSGTVFRGILKDGKLVAVKLLDATSLQSEREFQNELQILGGLRSPLIVNLLGYCVEKSKRLVVYEYMPNRSLQESLFSESNLSLSWARRFDIILDIAKALAFLHLECDPPVIHGDVKPSNVLLDSEYKAKLSDFGLSRIKLEGEFGVDLFSQDLGKSQELWKSQELSGNLGTGGVDTETPAIGTPVESHDEVDFALALQASSSSKNSKISQNIRNVNFGTLNFNSTTSVTENDSQNRNDKGKEISRIENGREDWNKFLNYDEEMNSTDHSKELNLNAASVGVGDDNAIGTKLWGKDWWWKQDGSGELCSRDYVMEWIGSQICPSTNPDWDEEKTCSPQKGELDHSTQHDKCEDKFENLLEDSGFECSKKGLENEESRRWRTRNKKQRKMQEWWKEEHLDELCRKSNKANKVEIKLKNRVKVPHFSLAKHFSFKRKKVRQQNQNLTDPDGEFSFRKGWKKKNARSISSDMFSGDLFSRELSSTTSMRGTLCYVAPEYGGCGFLMEKADIYSFGVLILVIVSGRRPLHVLSSPMKLEKANLISWCRHLAHAGNVLELMDEKLKDNYNKEQASLCINLALSCLQKVPELRPDIADIIKILKGEMELQLLPFEFSPSPPSKLFSRSRRRQKSNAE